MSGGIDPWGATYLLITDPGRPAHVLLSIDDYRALTGASTRIADLLAMPGAHDIEFEAPRAEGLWRPAGFD